MELQKDITKALRKGHHLVKGKTSNAASSMTSVDTRKHVEMGDREPVRREHGH